MITIYLEDSDYRHILFPNHISFTGLLQPTADTIYVKQDKENLQEYLKEMNSLNLQGVYEIVMPSVAEYNLSTPEDIFDFMIVYFKFPDKESTKIKFGKLLPSEQKDFIKLSKAIGTWYTPQFRQNLKVYKLLEAMSMNNHSMLKTWYRLTQYFTVSKLWASFLTFSLKIKTLDPDEDIPHWYRQTLERAQQRKLFYKPGLETLKHIQLPYNVLVPRILLRMRNKHDSK